jgi:hypothetical protein
MSSFKELRQKYLAISDAIVAILLGLVMLATAKWVNWSDFLDKDNFGLILAIIAVLALGGYVSLVFGIRRPKIQRLSKSRQFRNIVLLLLGYFVVVIALYLLQKIVQPLGDFALSAALVAAWRTLWIYMRTILLF